LGHTK